MAPATSPQGAVRRSRRLPCLSCKCITICVSLSVILLLVPFLLLCVLPWTISLLNEEEYFAELQRYNEQESFWDWLTPELRNDPGLKWSEPTPYNERPRVPLIRDITQLRTTSWKKQMNLNEDGTAEYPAQEFWIYIGGTPKTGEREMEDPTGTGTSQRGDAERQQDETSNADDEKKGWLFWANGHIMDFVLGSKLLRTIVGSLVSLPGPSCVDEPYICDSFNEGFDRLLESYHAQYRSSQTGLAFADCDVSFGVCDEWGTDPVMLAYVRTSSPCRMKMSEFRFICSIKWYFVALPLRRMPFHRTVRLSSLLPSTSRTTPTTAPGSKRDKVLDPVVPVFPSAFEQLHSLVSHSGSVEALEFQDHEIWELNVEPQVIKDPDTESYRTSNRSDHPL